VQYPPNGIPSHLPDHLSTIYHSLIPLKNGIDINMVGQCRLHDCPDSGIHPGGIAAARHHADAIQFRMCHWRFLRFACDCIQALKLIKVHGKRVIEAIKIFHDRFFKGPARRTNIFY
jgi:hypothetical protein